MAHFEKTVAGRACSIRFLILALTMLGANLASAQPGALFSRSDYPVDYFQFGEDGPMVIADFNNDGKLDIAIGAALGLAVAWATETEHFSPSRVQWQSAAA